MLRRRLIRVTFLLPLAFVVGVWILSHFYFVSLQYDGFSAIHFMGHDGRVLLFLRFGHQRNSRFTFNWQHHSESDFFVRAAGPHNFLGFASRSWPDAFQPSAPYLHVIDFPLWFPALIAVLPFVFVFRRRKKHDASASFPIEVATH